MKNLEQIRAANALAYAKADAKKSGAQGGEVVKKLPALIMSNGLLAAAAYALDKGGGWSACFDYMAAHLAHREVGIVPPDKNDLKKLLDYLAEQADSLTLKRATDEALAWLCYATRFVRESDKGGSNNDSNES